MFTEARCVRCGLEERDCECGCDCWDYEPRLREVVTVEPWRDLFRLATREDGPIIVGEPVPDGVRWLYRGARIDQPQEQWFSWTYERGVADAHAQGDGERAVWRIPYDRDNLYMVGDLAFEFEVVVDPRRIPEPTRIKV
jgi:hypothetical protein